MRLVHCNFGSFTIIVPILSDIDFVSRLMTAGSGTDNKVQNDQEKYQYKDSEEGGENET